MPFSSVIISLIIIKSFFCRGCIMSIGTPMFLLFYNSIMIRDFTPDRSEKTRASKPTLSFVRSENKVRSIWQYLKRYEDPTFVNRRIQVDYPSVVETLRNKKAQHIADCIRQAEAYFQTASTSDLSIKPLI